MTRLFIGFYLGVLAVLFLAWYIHGVVTERRRTADRARMFEEAHGGGARLVARELDAAPPEDRESVLQGLRKQFDYALDIVPVTSLPAAAQRRIMGGNDVAYVNPESEREVVVAALSSGSEVVRLGPFPDYGRRSIEEAIGGWMRLTAQHLNSATRETRRAVLEELRARFFFPLEVVGREELPTEPRRRLSTGADVVFYTKDELAFASSPLSGGTEVIRGGPFPQWEKIEQKAATTTLALVLLPAALAIALLLRPVAEQLRRVENAAKAIAAGDLSTRVDERRVRAAKSLAEAFNTMASRTETLVRTQRELLQAVSHELRTPLSRMRFAIDLVETAKDETERRERLDALDAATEELDDLVGELLSYVRMETAEPELHPENVAVRDVLETMVPKYAGLHPTIDFGVNDNVRASEVHVFADRQSLQRVVGNLLSNAGRFAKTKVAISAIASNAETTIDIDDDGAGIPEAGRERVFEPFVRLEDRSSTNGDGVGLGLALVKRIVTQHGGSVEVLTSPLGGCRIRTIWPREAGNAK